MVHKLSMAASTVAVVVLALAILALIKMIKPDTPFLDYEFIDDKRNKHAHLILSLTVLVGFVLAAALFTGVGVRLNSRMTKCFRPA